MKTMKKLFALTLAMMMVFSLALSANAEMTDEGSVKITNAAAGETYEFYRIYDLDSVSADGKGVIYVTNTKWDTFGADTYVTITGGYVTGLESFTTNVAQTFAEAAIGAGIAYDKTATASASGELTVEDLKYGYYVMKSNRPAEEPKYTVFTLSSGTPVEITEKNKSDLPEFEKTIQEDSNSQFGKSNDADVGQEITFKLTVTAAAGTDTYSITDKLTNLEFVEITGAKHTSGGVTADMTEGNDYVFTTNTDGFTIEFKEDFRKELKDNDVIEITYTAKLTEAAKTEGEGTNEATFTYGNESETGSTTTKTYKITVTKTDDNVKVEERKPLSGATFVLKKGDQFYYYNENTKAVEWVASQDDATKVTSDDNGVLVFEGIDADDYTLVEIKAPNGYVLPTDGEDVTVDANEDVSITNTLGEKLPETGGMGTTLFYALGGLMVAAAAVLLVTKKRMSAM